MKHLKNFVWMLGLGLIEMPLFALSFIVVPVSLLFCKEEDSHLPRWARYWETYDYDINGDPSWQGIEHANGKQRTYWWRLKWLLRNMLGTFQYEVLGFDLEDVKEFKVSGDIFTSNIPAHEGWLYAEAITDKKTYPCYYFVKQYGNSGMCLRVYMGWAFRHNRPVERWDKTGRCHFAFSIELFQQYKI